MTTIRLMLGVHDKINKHCEKTTISIKTIPTETPVFIRTTPTNKLKNEPKPPENTNNYFIFDKTR